jgi:rubrerythrin
MSNELFKDKATLLKSAIKGEEDGYRFYGFLAEKTANEEARIRLEHLSDDEKRHKATLVNLYRKYIGGEPGELPEKGIGPLDKVFEKGRLKRLKSEMEYINLAIEAELAATKFYKMGRDAVDDKEFKDILHQLSEEENGHYEWLMAERTALSGGYFWFSNDGSSPMED